MNNDELQNIWQAYDKKLERSLAINMHCLQTIQTQKARSKLTPVMVLRIVEMIFHLYILSKLGGFLYNNIGQLQYVIAAAALIIFYIIAFINCLKQLALIVQVNYTGNITDIQRKLNLLQTYIINYVRLGFLCIPTYLAYPIIAFKAFGNIDIVSVFTTNWWIAQIAFTILIIPVCAWLYTTISIKNMHKKWVRVFIEKSTGSSVTKAIDFINEIDAFCGSKEDVSENTLKS